MPEHPGKFSGGEAKSGTRAEYSQWEPGGDPRPSRCTDEVECKLMDAENDVALPEHLRDLYKESCQLLDQPQQQQALAQLLIRYQDVFSQGDHDVGLTHEMTHDIPVFPGTVPIKQPPHRLGPEKEEEVRRQVEGLLDRGLIEPASGAWSSPVVLV